MELLYIILIVNTMNIKLSILNKYHENACEKISLANIFVFHIDRPKKMSFPTFPGWKMIKLISILLQTP